MKLDRADYLPKVAGRSLALLSSRRRLPVLGAAVTLLVVLMLLVALLPTAISARYLAAGSRLLAGSGDASGDGRERVAGYYEQARQRSPTDPELDRALARAYLRLNQPQAAVAALEQPYRLQPDSLMIRQELAQAYDAGGQIQRADGLWRALGLSASDMLAQGQQVREAHRFAGALAWYDRAARASGGLDSSICYYRALALRDQGNRTSDAAHDKDIHVA